MNYFFTIFLLTSLFVFNAFGSTENSFEKCIEHAVKMETAIQTRVEARLCEEQIMFTALGIQQKVSEHVAGFDEACGTNNQKCLDAIVAVEASLLANEDAFGMITSEEYLAVEPKWKRNVSDSLEEINTKLMELHSLTGSSQNFRVSKK